MQTKMDTTMRYNDAASSHSSNFPYHPHNIESNRAFGSSQFGSENDSTSESPYAGWQNLNASAINSNWGETGKPVAGHAIHVDASGKEEKMMVDNDSTSTFSGLVGATGGADNFSEEKSGSGFGGGNSARPPPSHMPRLGLLGGGESAMAAPATNWSGAQGPTSTSSTWGTRPNGSVDMNVSSNAGAPNKPQQGSWAQAAGKGLSPGSSQDLTSPETPTEGTSTRDIAEQEAHEMRMKVAFSQGWGPGGVNQDTPWKTDETISQEGKEDSTMWRPPINNGTDIWETNLRINKGNGPPPAPVPTTTAPPWGHTPATNIGGHWGDDEPRSTWNSGSIQAPVTGNWSDPNVVNANSMYSGSASSDKQWNSNQSSWAGDSSADCSWNARNRQSINWSPAATPKKEMPPSGWEPPVSPPVRRPTSGNYDDGTSAWGNPGRQGKVSHWKEMPSAKPIINNMLGGNNGMMNMQQSGPGMIRLPNSGKPDIGNTWSKPPPITRSSNWQEIPSHRDSPTIGSWNEDQMKNSMQFGGNVNWNDQNNQLSWGIKPKANSATWADGQVDTSSWLGPAKQGGKPLCKDIVYASKQFRILTEYGYRKEDVENALRNNNMNLEEAAAELQALSAGNMEVDGFGGRKVRPANSFEDMPMSDHNMDSFSSNNFPAQNNFQNSLHFSGAGQHGFKQPPPKQSGPVNSSSVLGGQQVGGSTSNNLSPALIQKLLQQQQLMNLNNVQPIGNHKFATNAQLRHLVQQIQMAVQAGHLNAQILNQPLAPPTLQLLYQLLQQIKVLGSLHQQQLLQSSHMSKQGIPANNAAALQTNVQIAQAKSRIANLQNQICAQQALFIKQQQPPPIQQQQHVPPHHSGSQTSADIFKPDSLPGLHSDFRDLTIKDISHHQSRLKQWKLSSTDKDDGNTEIHQPNNSGDFSRAPGPINSKQQAANPNSSIHSLLEPNDSTTWNTGLGGRGDSSWLPGVSSADSVSASSASSLSVNSDGKDVSAGGTPNYLTDLVPEFEPGKPWKGTQMKNIEDDPHITPGSIARSPLSVNSIKDSNLFWPSKSSPANSNSEVPSNTWGYNSQGGNSSSNVNMKSGNSNWNPDFTNESWGPLSSKSRNNSTSGLNPGQGWDQQYNSTFLILKNLTPQIDGSTLKTLCMQHGPLQMFHLFLNRGVALVRYSSREEASKAQSALDNCVLSNTTMLADIPSESEIQQYLQVSSGQAGGGSSSNNTWPTSVPPSGTGPSSFQAPSSAFYSSGSGGSANWNTNAGGSTSQLWSFSNSSLWGSSQHGSNDHEGSTNPINYLPNDLLGGEPI